MKIFQIIFLFAFLLVWANISYAQQQGDTSKVLVTFNEPMSRDGIFDINNYHIYKDDSTPIKIYKVGLAPGDSVIILFTEKQSSSSSYKVYIDNLKDKSGNFISNNRKMTAY
ncbi:MAG: Ig-like domain-containing protein [Ignavibacteriaceae bacterium]